MTWRESAKGRPVSNREAIKRWHSPTTSCRSVQSEFTGRRVQKQLLLQSCRRMQCQEMIQMGDGRVDSNAARLVLIDEWGEVVLLPR